MIKIIQQTIKNSKIFKPIYYRYEFGNDSITNEINDKRISKEKLKELWISKGIFSNFQPNVELMIEVGNELQVDAVLAYKMNHWKIWIYFIDLKSKETYVKDDYFDWQSWDKELKNFDEQFFAEIAEKRYHQ